jgi:hypothetical protein
MRTRELNDAVAMRYAGGGSLLQPRVLTPAQATKDTDRLPVASKPVTGLRRWLIRRRLARQYRAECAAARAGGAA